VRVKNGHLPLVSVRTNKPLSKNIILKVMALLAKVEVEAPIRIGDEIIPDLFDTNVGIVATKNILKIA
jgi:CxxC motif-containing protein